MVAGVELQKGEGLSELMKKSYKRRGEQKNVKRLQKRVGGGGGHLKK